MSLIHKGVYLHKDKDGATRPVMIEIDISDALLTTLAQGAANQYGDVNTCEPADCGPTYLTGRRIPASVRVIPANQPHNHESHATPRWFAELNV